MPGYWTKAGGVRYTLIFLDKRRSQDNGVSAEQWKTQLRHVDPRSGFEVTARPHTIEGVVVAAMPSVRHECCLFWGVQDDCSKLNKDI